MVRLSVMHVANNHVGISIPLGIGLFVVVSAIVALCANHARRASRKDQGSTDNIGGTTEKMCDSSREDNYQEKFAPRSPLRSPKQLITTISNKAMTSFIVNHKRGRGHDGGGSDAAVEEGFGQGGLWQKEILMGVKCQPPEFSGVIYYNCDGHQVSEFPPRSPRSPRVAHSPDFTFPMIKSSV
ncbi:hypothetical protein Lser_V15G15161 [Lactuca serriola]